MAEYKKLSLEELLKQSHDHAAWYWIGMAYFERQDFVNAAKWLEKAMNDSGNEWGRGARFNLGLMRYGGFHPRASKDEALRLFEKNLKGSMSNLYAGLLFYRPDFTVTMD